MIQIVPFDTSHFLHCRPHLCMRSGAALPMVLLFAAFALVLATVYVGAQLTIGKPALGGARSLQALCNARSGIWKGLEMLSKPPSDTLAHINSLDSMFNKQLFGKQVSINTDTNSSLMPDDSPAVVHPYSVDSFGTASISLTLQPCFRVLLSKGEFGTVSKTVSVLLGGSLYSSSDTVCYLLTGAKPEGGTLEGNVSLVAPQTPVAGAQPVAAPILQSTASTTQSTLASATQRTQSLLEFRPADVARQASYFRTRLAQKVDTILPSAPLDIQSSDQCTQIPEVVNGPLFLNSSMSSIVWKEKRRVLVDGNILITGNTVVENVEFVCTGDLKCLDQSALRNVSVFTAKQLVIGDRSRFSGNALALVSVLVCNDAQIGNRSVIIAFGEDQSKPIDSTHQQTQKLPISVYLKDNVSVDGVIVACGTPGGIETDKNTIVNGALWASGAIVHEGSLFGILRANQLTDMQTIKAAAASGQGLPVNKNILSGSIKPLQSVTGYIWPYFMGKQIITKWDEG
jgi:hypothetical protein